MTYLVAGACGFIGTNFVRLVLDEEPDAAVVAIDNMGFAANPANLEPLRDRVVVETVDIADYDAVADVYERHLPAVVVNFAAESHNDRAIVSPSSFMRSNALGAQVLLEASRRFGVDRHVHVSTIEVYGELPDDAAWFTEASPLNAKTPYSAAKAAGDQMVRAYMHTYPEMSIAMTHCANNYGPYQFPEKLIPLAITNVIRGRKVPIYGDGLQRRDWLHVLDHCHAIRAIARAPRTPVTTAAATNPALLPIYDISARNEVTNLEIIARVLSAMDKDATEWVEHVPDRPNHDRRYLIDPSKIERELGWRPTVDFAEGIVDTVRWYVDNRSWWEDILARTGDLQFAWGDATPDAP